MISQQLTLQKISSNHLNAELLKIARIRSWHKVKSPDASKELYEVTVDEIDTGPDSNCIILYTLLDGKDMELFALHDQNSYKVVNQRIHNKMTYDLLDALKKCDLNKLKRLAAETTYCEFHDYDDDSSNRICLNCGHRA